MVIENIRQREREREGGGERERDREREREINRVYKEIYESMIIVKRERRAEQIER